MLKSSLQKLIQEKKTIHITYKRERDEMINSYNLEPLEIKDEYTKESSGYVTYLFAIKLPKTYNSKPQKFILGRIISAY
jgi:hypothetical protein